MAVGIRRHPRPVVVVALAVAIVTNQKLQDVWLSED
jgi:hypothetical protein